MSYPGFLVILRYYELKSMKFGKGPARMSEEEWREVIESMNEKVSIIYGLGQMARTGCDTHLLSSLVLLQLSTTVFTIGK